MLEKVTILRSDAIKKGVARAPHRALLYSTGVSKKNIDKPFIIEKIQNFIFEQNSMSQFKQVIDSRFVKVKMNLLLGEGKNAFEQYLKFNTNISSNEILGIKKDNSATNMYDFFMDIINKRKEQDDRKK